MAKLDTCGNCGASMEGQEDDELCDECSVAIFGEGDELKDDENYIGL